MPSIPDKIILVHKGALGDFLHIWPSIYSLTKNWPRKKIYWAGRISYNLWTEPLGIFNCPFNLTQSVNKLYATNKWPDGLYNTLVIWFGLQKKTIEADFPGLWYMHGVEPENYIPPRNLYAQQLVQKGVKYFEDWPLAWKNYILSTLKGDREFEQLNDLVLFFPGAGHPAKCWPLENFLALAEYIDKLGYSPMFILGPAEIDRNIEVQNFKYIYCQDFITLQTYLQQALFVIGNDSGPLHLASYMQVPTLGIYGPTSVKQWGPFNGNTVSLNIECSPCTQIGDINCPNPRCMQQITPEMVENKLGKLLRKNKR